MSTTSKNGKKTRGRAFQPGNKFGRGRPEGSRNRATILLQQLLDKEAEAIARKAIELAKKGDAMALKLCLERLIPPTKDRYVHLDLPRVKSAEDVIKASTCLVQAVANGTVTPGEAQSVAALFEIHRRVTETGSLEERISQLEKRIEDRK
jgi:hypothetical protein